jgi:hypothetical protein
MAIGSGGGELEKVMLIISWAGDDQFEVHITSPKLSIQFQPSRFAEAPRERLGIFRLRWVQNLSKCGDAYATQFWG